ncbi:MAG: hypothetical protein LBF66_00705 [Holosporales bacterium]|nr:hypothetical protein [Holosporales bacterium]
MGRVLTHYADLPKLSVQVGIYKLCRNAFGADDASRANAIGDLLAVLPEYASDYDVVSDILQTIFANSELLGEYIPYVPHLLHDTAFLTFCMGQPPLKDQLLKTGFSPDITKAHATESFAAVGHRPVNEIYLSLLCQLLSFGTNDDVVKNACIDLLNTGRNTPRYAGTSVEQLLAVVPETCASYGRMFVLIRNLALDQSNFLARLDLVKAEIDSTENRTKLLTSVLLKVASTSKHDQFAVAIGECFSTRSKLTTPDDPTSVLENERALEQNVKTLVNLFPQFPPERSALSRCIFDVCNNPDAFYANVAQLQKTMAGAVDQSILFARAFTRFDDVVVAMDECFATGTTTALSEICFSHPRRPDTILSHCASKNLGELIAAFNRPKPPADEQIADILLMTICNDLRNTVLNDLRLCRADGEAFLLINTTNMLDNLTNALRGMLPNMLRSFLFVEDSVFEANMKAAMQHLGF